MATQSNNTPSGVIATGLPLPSPVEPTSLPARMTYADEFIQIVDLRRRVERRLAEVVHIIEGNDPRHVVTLPKSGMRLRAARPGFFVFDGGRSDG